MAQRVEASYESDWTDFFSWTAGQESTAILIASGACEDLSRSGNVLIVAKFGRKPGIPALRVTGKGSGCIRGVWL